MTKAIIYHNPRCSKSRETLKLLEQHNIEHDIHLYLNNPLTKPSLKQLLEELELPVRDIIRSGEDEYKEMGLGTENLTDEQLLDAIVTTPKLMQRPIVSYQGKARIGRPPEQVLDLFK
ncbi:arsenate reductase (glutaredoxin) [Gynuella sunshinyii]|uniref:Arsenate reductase n=1 Tax=Gynuella sunshinyii YC6258 TaxID=1445510 RepID=A0A0C5V6Z7_9GAMM|nr:arsenate reductase (glutaredoxin) [Gynuella sunshinyii]AJQ95190.1 arsenate reductase and related protein, glutaredoxin family [Gynuella sunshinyii YC6258]